MCECGLSSAKESPDERLGSKSTLVNDGWPVSSWPIPYYTIESLKCSRPPIVGYGQLAGHSKREKQRIEMIEKMKRTQLVASIIPSTTTLFEMSGDDDVIDALVGHGQVVWRRNFFPPHSVSFKALITRCPSSSY